MLLAVATLLAVACAPEPARTGTRPDVTNVLVGPPRARGVSSPDGVVAACSLEAARAGASVLADGGNAVDAAVATVLALGATDPASLGLGSDIVMLIHTADGRNIVVEDPSFVPLRVEPGRLAEVRRTKTHWGDSWGRIGATVPTGLAVVGTALERFGTRPFRELVRPAVDLALSGYPLGRYQRAVLGVHRRGILECPEMASIFLDARGEVPPTGTIVGRNPELATTLRRLAEHGWRDFYTGSVAADIERDMLANGGWISRADLVRALRRVRVSRSLEVPYRDRLILVPDEPLGGPTLELATQIIGRFPRAMIERDTVDRLQLVTEAFRLALYARQLDAMGAGGGPGFSDLGASKGTDSASRLAGLIRFGRKVPLEDLLETLVPGLGSHTTQVSVMDRDGNAVSVTGTLGRFFGTKAVTPGLGFPYNILMSGFQFEDPRKPSFPRPLTPIRGEMTPTILLREGRAEAVLGTGGSERIPPIVFNVLSNLVDRGMGLAEAVSFPRIAWNGGSERMIYLEIRPPIGPGVVGALEARGYEHVLAVSYPAKATSRGLLGGVHAVAFDPETGLFTGVGDPRRDGAAAVPPGAGTH